MFQLNTIYGTTIDIFQHPIHEILDTIKFHSELRIYGQRITLLGNVIGQLGTVFYSQVFINNP